MDVLTDPAHQKTCHTLIRMLVEWADEDTVTGAITAAETTP